MTQKRDGSSIQINCNIDRDDSEWLHNTYPSASYSWVFTMLLKKFREVHTATPQDYATIGAIALRKDIANG